MNKKKLATILGVLFLLLVIAMFYHQSSRIQPPPPLTEKESQMADKLFSSVKEQCFGRYQFKVPVSFNNSLLDMSWINNIRIVSKRLYLPAFEQRIRLREKELMGSKTVNVIDQPFLKKVYRLNDNAVIFDRNKNESVAGYGRILEGHFYSNGVAFTLTREITDLTDPRYKNDKQDLINAGVKAPFLNTKEQTLAEMKDLLSRLTGRNDNETPTVAGVCIPNGFIRDGSTNAREKVALRYEQDGYIFAVQSDNTLPKGTSLLDRDDEINPEIHKSGAQTLKKGVVNLENIPTEEWLIKSKQEIYQPETKETALYIFTMYGNEKQANFKHPIFSVDLHNEGEEVKAYSDAELVDIWTRITRTIVYRNNAF